MCVYDARLSCYLALCFMNGTWKWRNMKKGIVCACVCVCVLDVCVMRMCMYASA